MKGQSLTIAWLFAHFHRRRAMQRRCRGVLAAIVLLAGSNLAFGEFVDTFEADTVGSFPANWDPWIPGGPTSDTVVIDETTDPGGVFDGEKSARVTFTGGYGSGIITSFDPVEQGIVEFYSRVDDYSERIQIMGLFSYPETEEPGSLLAYVQAMHPFSNYLLRGAGHQDFDTGVPVVLGQYVKFDLHFDVGSGLCSLFINDAATDAVDVPLQNPSDGVTTIRSIHVSDTGGSARWYLDNVSVVPEPGTLCLLVVGSLAVLRRRRH